MLKGEYYTTPEILPTIIPELQNRSVISVVNGYGHFSVLTSGKLLMWSEYSDGALGLGDPGKVPAGSPGGYAEGEQRVWAQADEISPDVTVPTEVRFNHRLTTKGRGKRYCFAAAAGLYRTAALIIDLAEDEVLPEGPK